MKRLVVTAAALLWLLLPATALAANNPLSAACQAQNGAGNASVACSGTGNDTITGSNGIIYKVTLIIATIAGITAVIIVIVGGFMLVTANGDPRKVEQARTAIIGALVGLVLIALATSIVVFVVGKL